MSKTFFGVHPAVEKATTDNETPTPGYLYAEITKITFEGAKECEKLRNQLLPKLKGSAAVRIKVLIILKYLLEHGHPHFQTVLQIKADEIKPCLEYKAPLDPLHGDAPARLVREKAALVMNSLYETRTDAPLEYNTTASTSGQTNTTTLGTSISTGSNPSGSHSNNSVVLSGKGPTSIEGPRPANQRKPNMGVLDSLKATAGKLTSSNNPSKHFKPGPGTGRGIFLNTNHLIQPTEQAFVDAPRDAGKPGGGWDVNESDNSQINSPEKELVDQICNIANNKPNVPPTRPEIKDFVTAIQQYDTIMVAYELARQLQHQNWKNRLRSLFLIHELFTNETPGVKDYFSTEGYHVLTALKGSVQTTIKQKAQQVIDLLPTDIQQLQSSSPSFQPELWTTEDNAIQEDTTNMFFGLDINDESNISSAQPSLFNIEPSPFPSNELPKVSPNPISPPSHNHHPVHNHQQQQSTQQPSQQPQSQIPKNLNSSNPNLNPVSSPPTNKPLTSANNDLSQLFTSPEPAPVNKIVNTLKEINLQNPYLVSAGTPPAAAYPYVQPTYAYPQVMPMYPGYPNFTTAPVTASNYQMSTQNYPGFSANVSGTGSTSFDFVSSDKAEKKDPFDFVKVGQY